MENKELDELNTLSSQVLNYYRRYSQNQNFSSYLRGEIPNTEDTREFVRNASDTKITTVQEEMRPPLIGCDNNENDLNISNIDDPVQNPSPASSITSNRKLEWDNLADIGYGNYQKQNNLQKSLSLPILTAFQKIDLGNKNFRLSPEGNVTDNATQTVLKCSPAESSSTCSYKQISPIETTTSSVKEDPKVIDVTSSYSSFSQVKTTTETEFTDIECSAMNSDTLKFFNKDIGLPKAESTPNNVNFQQRIDNLDLVGKKESKKDEDLKDSSKSDQQNSDYNPSSTKPVNLNEYNFSGKVEANEIKCVAKCVTSNIKHLSITKPLSVECCNYKDISDKIIQTSFFKKNPMNSVAVQTEKCILGDEHVKENKIYPVYENRQVVEHVKFGNTSGEPSLRSLGTNTDSDLIISQCNSFEYMNGANASEVSKSDTEKSPLSTSSSTSRNKLITGTTNLRRTHVKSDLTVTSENEKSVSSNATDLSSKASPLAEIISSKLSNHMISDVEKSIVMLQKLLKSKKYNKVTKQYYIKKIVQKIINCSYSSETSINSEVPTESSDDNQCNQGEPIKKVIKQTESTQEQRLQDNIPWIPPILDNNKTLDLKKNKHLEIKTFAIEILPETSPKEKSEICHPLSFKPKSNRFTITNNYHNCDRKSEDFSQIGDTNLENSVTPQSNPQSLLETPNFSNKSKGLMNWKESLTLSEKLFEQKLGKLHCGDGSSNESELLLNFAKKERQNQINWINNEINHLNKLKNLLKRTDKEDTVEMEMLTKPRIEDMRENNKTTSVYVITTERSSKSSNNSYTSSVRSDTKKNLTEKCRCSPSQKGNLPCGSIDCPLLKFRSEKSFKTNFQKMLKNDLKTTNLSNNGFGNDIENAKLIASEIYRGKSPNSCVRRFVFEMPMCANDCNKKCSNKKKLQVNSQKITFDTEHAGDKQFEIKPHIPKLPGCNIDMDPQNAKLIASEICKGSLPNSCVRRYVFEIPLSMDETSNASSLKGSVFENKISSKYSTSSSVSNKVKLPKCKCKNKHVEKKCKCENTLSILKVSEDEDKKFESTDILCVCQVGDDKAKGKLCQCDNAKNTPIKLIEANVLSDPKKDYRICVKQTGIGDSVSYVELPECSVQTSKCNDTGTQHFECNTKERSEICSHDKSCCVIPVRTPCNNVAVNCETIKKVHTGVTPLESACVSSSCSQNNQCINTDCKETCDKEGQFQANGFSKDYYDKSSQYENQKWTGKTESGSSYNSTSSESTSSFEETPQLCLCCNRAEAKFRSTLHHIPAQLRNALCQPCYTRSQQINWPHSKPYYNYPGHVCNCYTMIKTETVRNIQRTVEELEDLERERNFCSCSYGCRTRKHCGYSKCSKKKPRHKNSIAYTLTFEDVEKTDSEGESKKLKNKRPLEEVRVKIPRFVKKSYKEKENRRKSKHRRHHKKNRASKYLTLQDYLCINKPNFIANAEERRKVMIELAYLREERCQKYKELLVMSNGVFPKNKSNKLSKSRMFTSKEMKEITEKKYKKLPEVQRKLAENRAKQIKRANKILVDTFNRKLRDNVLKGKVTLSTNVSVIKLP